MLATGFQVNKFRKNLNIDRRYNDHTTREKKFSGYIR